MIEGVCFLRCSGGIEMPLHPFHHIIGRRIDARTGIHNVWNDIIRIVLVERIKPGHQSLFLLVAQCRGGIAHTRRFEYPALQEVGKVAFARLGERITHQAITEV
ncbi:hypothetical protein D9M69_615130 [compost metagenome]